jgi:pyocin large subunit-like protein
MPETNENTEMVVESASIAIGSQASLVVPSELESQQLPVEQAVANVNKENGGRKEVAPRSEMWQHFTKVKDNAGSVRHARCNYCQRNMKAEPDRHGTTSLRRHFNACKRNPHKFNKDPMQGTLQATQYEGVSTWRFGQDALRAAFAEMIIVDELSFSFGEKPRF